MANGIAKDFQVILKIQYQNSNLEKLEYRGKLLRNELMWGVYNEKPIIKAEENDSILKMRQKTFINIGANVQN